MDTVVRRDRLKDADRALWERVTRTVVPLRPAAQPPGAEEKGAETPASAPATTATGSGEAATAPPPTLPARDEPRRHPLRRAGDLDRRTRRKLVRGALPIEARLDLHGMTQADAHGALLRFIDESAVRRRRVVLVITGKGSGGEGRGVLRRSVPHWLGSREMARHVVGFGPAHPAHGGEGALYVRLRVGRD